MKYLPLLLLLTSCAYYKCPSKLEICRMEQQACRADYQHLTQNKLLSRKCGAGGL